MRRLCVFCGSKAGTDPDHQRLARHLGEAIARRHFGLVTGGGRVGLMGVVADAAMGAGAEVIGVIPEALSRSEVAHGALTRLEVVPDMHARKARMAELSDAFVALPGGIGTLEELFEVLTWRQLRFHEKSVAVLGRHFWRPLEELLLHMESQGFLGADARALLSSHDDVDALLDAL